MKANRRMLLRFAGLTALGASGAIGVAQRILAAGPDPVAPGVYRVHGDARVNGKAAQPGMPIGPGDTVETGPGAEIVYVIGRDAYLQREMSRVSFAGAAAVEALRILTGKLLSVFGQSAKRITMPNATIGIRGTGCYIEAEESRSYFCLCYGAAEVAPTATPDRVHRYETRHHDKPFYITDRPESAMLPAKVVNHTDDELILLEALCGRRPPFFGKDANY